MSKYIIPFEECSREHLDLVGGKNASLGMLVSGGMPVPHGFALTIEAYKDIVHFNNLDKKIEAIILKADPNDSDSTLKASKDARELFIEGAVFSGAMKNEIKESYQALEKKYGVDNLPVAVRSSAVGEDAPDASFAGQHDSYLWVRGIDNVLTKIIECLSSLFTQRAIVYRASKGFQIVPAISVGVQKMVRPRSAGVMFTLNPITGDRSRVAIESVWGVGETLVAGEVNPDGFLVDKIFFSIKERKLGTKLIERVVDEVEGTKKLEVEEGRQNQPSLSDEEVIYLAKLGQKIEQYYKKPQDIEFAVEKEAAFPESIFIVQSRPETVWSRKKKAETKLSAMEYIAKDLKEGLKL